MSEGEYVGINPVRESPIVSSIVKLTSAANTGTFRRRRHGRRERLSRGSAASMLWEIGSVGRLDLGTGRDVETVLRSAVGTRRVVEA